jgi:hypothetical protein
MQSGTPRKIPSATSITRAVSMGGSAGAVHIVIAATHAARTTATARSQADALARFMRRLRRIFRNSATVKRRDRVTVSPAHQSCEASVMGGTST